MARSSFQKLKILYIMEYLLKYSDEEHLVTVAQLIKELDRHGIQAERKSIYADIEALRDYGMDIVQGIHRQNQFRTSIEEEALRSYH